MVGSSRKRILGECTNPRAISKRRRMPPEKVPTRAFENCPRSTASSSSRISVGAFFGRDAVNLGVDLQVFLGGQFGIGGERLGNHPDGVPHAFRILAHVVSGNLAPNPSLGGVSVVIMRMSVVLPAPLGPSRPKSSPCGTSKLTWSTATKSPNRLVSPWTSIAFICPCLPAGG